MSFDVCKNEQNKLFSLYCKVGVSNPYLVAQAATFDSICEEFDRNYNLLTDWGFDFKLKIVYE